MKVYVSIPISGKDYDTQKELAERVKGQLENEGHQVVTPFEIITDKSTPTHRAMGKDIEALLTCDAAIFLDGWNESKGCMLERSACKIYGIEIL